MKEIIFFKNEFCALEQVKVKALAQGAALRKGLFETMRARNNKIAFLDEHLKRLMHSCSLLKIKCPYSAKKLKSFIQKTVKLNKISDIRVKLTLAMANGCVDILITVEKYKSYARKKYSQGFCASVSTFCQNEKSIFSRIKTNNRKIFQLSLKEAKAKGSDEAIILNSRGYLCEASRSNIFFVKNKELFTPALSCGCLAGITRGKVLDLANKYNILIHRGNFTLHDLSKADEAFLTNSLMGIMPLAKVSGKTIGKKKCRPLTEFLSKKYNCLLK